MTEKLRPIAELPMPPLRQGVVAVLVRRQRWLVIRRSQQVRAPGMFCFPGGGLESGESESQALVRELREELNVDVRPRRRLWESVTSWNVQLAWWHAELLCGEEQIEPNQDEVAEFLWLRPEEIAELAELLPSNHDFLAAWRGGAFEL